MLGLLGWTFCVKEPDTYDVERVCRVAFTVDNLPSTNVLPIESRVDMQHWSSFSHRLPRKKKENENLAARAS